MMKNVVDGDLLLAIGVVFGELLAEHCGSQRERKVRAITRTHPRAVDRTALAIRTNVATNLEARAMGTKATFTKLLPIITIFQR